MEDFVPFDLAVKLKEKGFDWETSNVYERNTIACRYEDYPKPTISQVLKWLREEKDIDLVISPVFFYDGVLGKMREYGCKVFAPSLNESEHCGYHEEWEQASLAGVNYCLDNLI